MSIQTVSVEEDGLIKLSDENEKVEEVKAEAATEEVTEEEEQTEESEELAAAGEEETEEVQEKPKKKGGFQKKLERKDREIEALRQQMAEMQTKQTAPKEAVSFEKAKPDVTKFESYSDFTEAMSEWVAEKREAEKAAKSKQSEVMSEVQQAVSKYETALKELKKTTPDLDDVFEEVAHIRPCPALQEAIITSDVSAQVAYELAKNPEEFERINKLSPLLVAKEIGKIELRLSKAAEEKSAKIAEEKTKTTKAPAPLKTLAGKAVATTTKSLYDSENMDFKEWNRLREAELKKAQKRA